MATAMEMVTAAKAVIENLAPADVLAELERGDVLVVDVREPAEMADGVLPGAVHAPRGMLEFHADAATPYHIAGFDPARRVILYCAAGARSALAVRTLQALGYRDVAHLDGGFKRWREEGHPVEARP